MAKSFRVHKLSEGLKIVIKKPIQNEWITKDVYTQKSNRHNRIQVIISVDTYDIRTK